MPLQEQNSNHECPAYEPVAKLITRLLPGDSQATKLLRNSILDFSFDFSARTAFLKGPIGAGKSTIARIISFSKRLAPLKSEDAEHLIRDLRFSAPGLIDDRVMHWYVEAPLTGVVETLAEAQLLGIGKNVATGVQEKPGVFEVAQTGRRLAEGGAAVRLTGGIVFLDEIAEISQELQAKLLPVLSGGVFHRVGVESKDLTFRGITIAASWRNINGLLRPDLVSRLSDRVIAVPGLAHRGADILPLIEALQADLIKRYQEDVKEMSRDAAVDRYWLEKATTLKPVGADTVCRLAEVDWDSLGNLRGLTNALKQLLFSGKTFDQVISTLETIDPRDDEEDSLLDRLFQRKGDGSGLASHVSELEREDRAELRETLLNEASTRNRLFSHLGLDANKARYQVQQLNRSRKREKGAAHK
ncbi:MAG TPA: sigma 54-interacting transcriptional regulator [Terriglobales bacterium]|nr:sigma 54-interacting transcriptional regulator [Terriglobales bacterium]